MKMFQSATETSKSTGVSQYYLRKLIKEGKAPGVYSGRKFLFNVPALLEQLERESKQGVSD